MRSICGFKLHEHHSEHAEIIFVSTGVLCYLIVKLYYKFNRIMICMNNEQ